MKEFIVLIGNYGSGKTELALCFAFQAARQGKKTLLVDLDIVNPYFRSSEKAEELKRRGVCVITTPYACSNIDMPVVPVETAAAFDSDFDTVIFDVGGDAVGATALGQYYHRFQNVLSQLKVYFVVNTKRPLCASKDAVIKMMDQIQAVSRLTVGGLINNANLADQTTYRHLLEGNEILRQVSKETGVPVAFVAGTEKTLDDLKKHCQTGSFVLGRYLPISISMRPRWLDVR